MTDTSLRRWAAAAVTLVAAIAAIVSYMHIYLLAVRLGQPHLAAWLMPLSVDGSVGAASAALLSAARRGLKSPRTAQVMLGLGVLATLAANVYSGLGHGPAGMILACWPAIAFVGSTEVALGMVRRFGSSAIEPVTFEAMSAASSPPTPVIATARKPAATRSATRTGGRSRADKAAAIVAALPDISGAELGRKLKVSERSGRRYLAGIAERQAA